jgi:hypothetical protein
VVCGLRNINSKQGVGYILIAVTSFFLGIFFCLQVSSVIDLQVHKAVDACKNVLRGLHSNQITERELDRVST